MPTALKIMPRLDPATEKDYGFLWSTYLEADETIISAAWTLQAGLTEVAGAGKGHGILTGGTTYIWLSGGSAGRDYTATVHVHTSAGRSEEATLLIPVRDR